MEILNPSCSPIFPAFPLKSLSDSSSPASFRRGFDRSTILRSLEVVGENGNDDEVYVAVGKSVEKAMSLLSWTINYFKTKHVCLIHVYQPSKHIPTPLGKLLASQATPEVVSAYRQREKEQALTSLRTYLSACSSAKVNASIIITEANYLEKGILDLVNKHGIRRLVMGAPHENLIKMKKSSSRLNYAAKYIPLFCETWFISSKGKHIWTRHASEVSNSAHSSDFMSAVDNNNNNINNNNSNIYSSSSEISSPRYSRDKLERTGYSRFSSVYRMDRCETSNTVHSDSDIEEVASSSTFSPATRLCIRDIFGSASNRSCSSASWRSMETGLSPESDLNVDEERLYGQFVSAKLEAEASRNEAHADLLKHRKLKSEAREAVSKIKKFDYYLQREIKLRKVAEESLRTTREDQDNVLQEKEDATKELRWTRKNISRLKSWIQEADGKHDEVSTELKLVQENISALRHEKQQIWRQKRDALYWIDRWRSRGRGRSSSNFNGLVGFEEEISGLAEFSVSDLKSATCDFSESFKIGQGGYGCVYKGEMLGRTVAIRKLHLHNMRGESEFQQEVKVLGNLQHPHLVSLLGVCPEAWSVVYEYLPNGNLQDNLARKSNALSWKIRVRIIADIASALCFLHSSKPEKVVHGNLTPQKILLDSTMSSKINDFGISRLIADDDPNSPTARWSTNLKSGFPYTDPEFPRLGVLTPKSDVYSFGLIILQLLTKRPPVGLVGQVWKALSSEKLGAILDSSAGEWPEYVATRLAEIALQCCELKSSERPDMSPSLVWEIEHLHVSEERHVPPFFLCPILQEIMQDPQVAADGFTYEGEAMRGWLEKGKHTSPMTNLKLSHLRLTPNHAIRLAIQDWLCDSSR